MQLRKLEDELARLRAELDKPKDDAGPTRATLSKLQAQLRQKDDKLRALRDAIKVLEAKLVDALKRNADE